MKEEEENGMNKKQKMKKMKIRRKRIDKIVIVK